MKRHCFEYLCLLYCLCSFGVENDEHIVFQNKLKYQDKFYKITRASFFGCEGIEEFIGGFERKGKIFIIGNTWSCQLPFDADVILGEDKPWQIEIYEEGMAKDGRGKLLEPSNEHPNRTGFILIFDDINKSVFKLVRFGWGTATIDSCTDGDNGVIISGHATVNFDVNKFCKKVNVSSCPSCPSYGQVVFAGVNNPGDVYIGKLTDNLNEFEWLWILKGYRKPPSRIIVSSSGDVYFNCRGIKRISKTGDDLISIVEESKLQDIKLGLNLSVFHVVEGRGIIIGGICYKFTGRENWVAPVIQLYSFSGSLQGTLYDWPGELVGTDGLRLVAHSYIVDIDVLLDQIVLCANSSGMNSVILRSPIDITVKGVDKLSLPFRYINDSSQERIQRVPGIVHLAKFSFIDPSNFTCASWISYDGPSVSFLKADGIRLLDNIAVIWGSESDGLLQTTTELYRDVNHYLFEYNSSLRKIRPKYLMQDGPPVYLGLRGKGGYVTIFSGDFSCVLWSSAIPFLKPRAVFKCEDGIVITGNVYGQFEWNLSNIEFKSGQIYNWKVLHNELKKAAEGKASASCIRIWNKLSNNLKRKIMDLSPSDDLTSSEHITLKKEIYDEFNSLILSMDTYSPDLLSTSDFVDPERKLIELGNKGKLKSEEMYLLNRLLIEASFPECIFKIPKGNVLSTVDAFQEYFGGGLSDGFFLILRRVNK